MPITAEQFEQATGHPPQQDDLERCNCNKAGQPGHTQCGWNEEFNQPVFNINCSPEDYALWQQRINGES